MKNIKSTISPVVKDTLLMIREKYEGAILAGGYLRDMYFGIQSKDADIFIDGQGQNFNDSKIRDLFQLKDTDTIDLLNKKKADASGIKRSQHVVQVWDVFKDGEYLQLIILNKRPMDYLTRFFDTGINMCYYDGTQIRYLPEFLKDAKNKTITLRAPMTGDELQYCLEIHIKRILLKYDFDVLINVEKVTKKI